MGGNRHQRECGRNACGKSRSATARFVIGALLGAAVGVAAAVAQQPQEGAERTVQSGVFAAAQAERGQNSYASFCQACHGTDLRGANARPLTGPDFMRNWRGLTLADLFDRFQTMPPSANIHVDEETYVDILSFVLRTNGFPVGDDALTTAALATVLIQGEQGPEEVPDHSLVQVTGCLSRGADNTWIVTGATEPTRTRNPDPSVGGDREAARSRAGGSASFQLLYVFPSPDAMAGHLVEAKGFLIRGEPDALNVTAVSALGPTCR